MLVTVVIPTYNRAELVKRAIGSVLKQTHQAKEVIVVDDHSSDDTQQILSSFGNQIQIISNTENRGVSFSRNRGIEQATGEWIAFLDSDDEWHPGKLATQARYHDKNPKLMISQCDEIWIRNGVRVNPMNKHTKKGGWIFQECLPLCIVSPSAVIIKRDIFKDVGVFDEALPACEDYDLWLRIAQKFEIGFLDEKLVTRYGGHADQLSQKYWGMDRFRIQAMEKHVDRELDSASKYALLNELALKCGVFSAGAAKRGRAATAEEYADKQQNYQKLARQL